MIKYKLSGTRLYLYIQVLYIETLNLCVWLNKTECVKCYLSGIRRHEVDGKYVYTADGSHRWLVRLRIISIELVDIECVLGDVSGVQILPL